MGTPLNPNDAEDLPGIPVSGTVNGEEMTLHYAFISLQTKSKYQAMSSYVLRNKSRNVRLRPI